jgi:hypothetical protein
LCLKIIEKEICLFHIIADTCKKVKRHLNNSIKNKGGMKIVKKALIDKRKREEKKLGKKEE